MYIMYIHTHSYSNYSAKVFISFVINTGLWLQFVFFVHVLRIYTCLYLSQFHPIICSCINFLIYVIRYILYYFVPNALTYSWYKAYYLFPLSLLYSSTSKNILDTYFFNFVHKMVQFFQVKVVAKKNMRVLTYADLNLPAGSSLPDAAPSAPSSITREVRRERWHDVKMKHRKTYGKLAKNPQSMEQKWHVYVCNSISYFAHRKNLRVEENYIIIVESFVSGQVEFSMIWHFGWNSRKKHCSGFRYLPFSYLGSGFKQLHCHN